MPTVLVIYGLRFFFYSNENNEPPHIHVKKAEGTGKIWLEPQLEIAYLNGFSASEERLIKEIINTEAELFKTKWYAYFGK